MYARINNDTRIIDSQVGRQPPQGIGPPIDPPPAQDGVTYRLLVAPIEWNARPTETSALHWFADEDSPRWVEMATLGEMRGAALMKIDTAAEAVRLAVVNQMTMQTEEYRRVEVQARAWREAGYPENDEVTAPRGVAGWAMAKWRNGWTNRQAADDILATADGWMQILDTLRDLRLVNKEDVRHASGSLEISQIVADMLADVHAMAAQLQINLTLTE